MKKQVLITLFLLPIIGFSQNFSWGFPIPITNETEATITHYYDGNKLYRQYEKYDLEIFNYHVIVDQFSANDLERTATTILTEKKPLNGFGKLTHLKSFSTDISSVNSTFFYYNYNTKLKLNQLFWNNVNIESGEKGEAKSISKMQGTSIFKTGNWKLNQSANGKFYVILKETPYAKKENEKLGILLLDKNKNIIKEMTHTFSILDKRGKKNTPYVSNSGKIFFVKDVKLKKQKPFLNIYYWNSDNNEILEYSLKLEDNYQIYQYDIDFDDEDNMYFNGLLTHKGSKTFGLSIDLYGNASGVPASAILSVKIDTNGKLLYKKRNNFEKGILSNINLKGFELNNDKIWLLADRRYVAKKSTNSNIGQGVTNYNYTFQNTGILIGNLDNSTGKLNWLKDIKYDEAKTKNDNGAFLSYLYFFRNENLVILYNDTKQLETIINKRKIIYTKRVPIMDIFSDTGSVSRNEILNAGIGVEYREQFDLDTSVLLKIEENSYIIRAKSHAEYKYGYMNFN